MRMKEESKEAGLKLSIQKTEIMTSSTITSWQIEVVTDFIFLGFKFFFFLKSLLLGRKAMTNLDSVFKSRGITLLTKVCIVKGFSSSHVGI